MEQSKMPGPSFRKQDGPGVRAWMSSTARAAAGGWLLIMKEVLVKKFDFCTWHHVVPGRIAFLECVATEGTVAFINMHLGRT